MRHRKAWVDLAGIAYVMRYLGMIEGKPEIKGNRLRSVGQFVVHARHGAIFWYFVRGPMEVGRQKYDIVARSIRFGLRCCMNPLS